MFRPAQGPATRRVVERAAHAEAQRNCCKCASSREGSPRRARPGRESRARAGHTGPHQNQHVPHWGSKRAWSCPPNAARCSGVQSPCDVGCRSAPFSSSSCATCGGPRRTARLSRPRAAECYPRATTVWLSRGATPRLGRVRGDGGARAVLANCRAARAARSRVARRHAARGGAGRGGAGRGGAGRGGAGRGGAGRGASACP